MAGTTQQLMIGAHDLLLTGGASFVPGHGAPTGMALRTGSPGQTSAASFPKTVLAPGISVTDISFTYRYISGFGAAGYGHGTNLSLSVSDEALRRSGKVVYSSPHYTDYSYSANKSNYSLPVHVHVSGLAIPASPGFVSRLQCAPHRRPPTLGPLATPRLATPRHASPRLNKPRHATPRLATPRSHPRCTSLIPPLILSK